MDRFKYRVWFTPDYQEPEMIYDAEQTYDFGCQSKGSFYHWYFGEILEDKDCIVMQCTGLKDKNGKLIYVGDVLKDFETGLCSIAVIHEEFDEYYGSVQFKVITGSKYPTYYKATIAKEDAIIGNIYQNPELMEGNNG